MRKNTKYVSLYLIVNIVLLTVAFIVVFYAVEIYNYKSKDTAIDEQDYNLTVSNIKVEKPEKNEEENLNIVVPIMIENYTTPKATTNQYKYYYNQLDSNGKTIYDIIESNAENLKTGTYEIKLPNSISNLIEKDNTGSKLNLEFQSAWDAILMDNPEWFYLDVSKISLKIETMTRGNDKKYSLIIIPDGENYLESTYKNKDDVNMAIQQVSNKKNQIISSLTGSQYNQIKQVHDWFVDNLEYGTDNGRSAYNIYGALTMKQVVCEGYAEGFKCIMDQIGIPCILVCGQATNSEGNTENHEWNYVQLDGKWYGIDVTWDDPIISGGRTTFK